jgi:membrane associated rhomboid family serine protease
VKRLYGTYNPADPEVVENTTGLGFIIKPFYFVLLIWFVFWLDHRFYLDLYKFGIFPRHVEGLLGVFTTPLLHGSISHLAGNTLPILALGAGLYYFYPKIATRVVLISWLASGLAVWFVGRSSFHIGASGLIYSLAGFIFLSGLLRRQPNLLALSLLVVFLYGGLFWGLLPIEESVSWEAHLAGLTSGFALAFNYRNFGPRQKKYSWDIEEAEVVEDDTLEKQEEVPIVIRPEIEAWKQYSKNHISVIYHYQAQQKQPDEQNNTKE